MRAPPPYCSHSLAATARIRLLLLHLAAAHFAQLQLQVPAQGDAAACGALRRNVTAFERALWVILQLHAHFEPVTFGTVAFTATVPQRVLRLTHSMRSFPFHPEGVRRSLTP